jgi:carbon monoxide dehydrogenase subunit G
VWFEMRREDMGFVDRAPVVHVSEATVVAERAAVFAALVDPRCWKHWFPGVREVSYGSPPPHGVGTIRRAHVGGTRWEEELIAWDHDVRWAWTVTRASVPFASAQVESFELADAAGGTWVRWTLALEPRLLARIGTPFAARVVPRLLERAMRNLGIYLRQLPT